MPAVVRKSQADRSAETSGKILRVAHQLFAEKGFNGVTMRAVASGADVNLASIVYYFKNKEGLYLAVIQHYAEPLMNERMRLLQQADTAPSLKAYVRAFIEPTFRIILDESLGGPEHLRLLWRLPQEPINLLKKIHSRFHEPVVHEMLGRIRPYCDVNDVALSWKLHVMMSILYTTLGRCVDPIELDSGERWIADSWMKDNEQVLSMLIDTAVLVLSQPINLGEE